MKGTQCGMSTKNYTDFVIHIKLVQITLKQHVQNDNLAFFTAGNHFQRAKP